MTNYNHPVRILIILLMVTFTCNPTLFAQDTTGIKFSGKVLESGTGEPLHQAVVSVLSNSTFTNVDEQGSFSIKLPSASEVLMVSYPGYYSTEFFTYGKSDIVIYLTLDGDKSDDQEYQNSHGSQKLKSATNAVTLISKSNFEYTSASSVEKTLAGRVAGLNVSSHSGMPGSNSWVNLRGISSIYGRNEPLVMIDGMIHEINYPKDEIIEGYILNPFDIVDVDDIVSISVSNAGEGHLGNAGSNGLINIFTEQNENTSAAIIAKMYGGIAFPFAEQEVLDANQFRSYFQETLSDNYGISVDQINQALPWLNGGTDYRYNNNTNWQKELTKPAALQKYYIFLRGGDDIATYNISTGYLRHGAQYDDWKYSRYNLRLNGKINITNKLYVVPNTKLSLSDSYLSNMGPTEGLNPVLASIQKSPLLTAHERSTIDGSHLYPYDDITMFNISNPAVLVDKALAANRNFQFLSSGKVGYDINKNLSITNLLGFSINNDRQNIFIPDKGVVNINDFTFNSPQDMVTEFRSLQNNLTATYKNTFDNKHNIIANGGLRIMNNSYKNNSAIDLNTATDDFRSLGKGKINSFLRSNGGQFNEVKWVSYYADVKYSMYDKYYIQSSMSLDASSVFSKEQRYNFYPSIFTAWRMSSEDFMSNLTWINDMKLRVGYSLSGNMFNSAYQYSKLTYGGRRYGNASVPVRDYNVNADLEAEKKSSINAGIDLSFGKKAYNIHLNYHLSTVNNLVINQSLPYNFGFTDYVDNGGKLVNSGIELAADGLFNFGEAKLLVDATVTYQSNKIKSLELINTDTEFLLRDAPSAQYIISEGNPVNAFYGYKTNGIYSTDPSTGIIGPNGRPMSAGDVIFDDVDGNGIIDDNDKQIIGDPNPDLFGSVNAVLSYKRFEFSTLFTYSVGNDVYNYVRYKATAMDSYANQSVDVIDRWQPTNPNSELPRATFGDPNGNNVFSDRWIEDGSYLRLKQLTISYTTPNIYKLKKETKFYITGTNLLTLTKYSGYDPEMMYQSDPFYMGIDYGKIPHTRSIIVGIQISL